MSAVFGEFPGEPYFRLPENWVSLGPPLQKTPIIRWMRVCLGQAAHHPKPSQSSYADEQGSWQSFLRAHENSHHPEILRIIKMEKPRITPDQAIRMLERGNSRYMSGGLEHPHLGQARRTLTAMQGQSPFAAVSILRGFQSPCGTDL